MAVDMAEILFILDIGLALLRVRPPQFIELTRFGLVRLEFSESDPKARSISVISEIGEVTIGSKAASMSVSPAEDGISKMEGLVSFLLKLPRGPVICLRLAPEAARLELADTERL